MALALSGRGDDAKAEWAGAGAALLGDVGAGTPPPPPDVLQVMTSSSHHLTSW